MLLRSQVLQIISRFLIEMFLFSIAINFVLLNCMVCGSHVKSDSVAGNNASVPIEQKIKNNNYLLIFNAASVLWSFLVNSIRYPITEFESGLFVDDVPRFYKPYDNVTNVLTDLKQKGFRLFAVLDTCVKDKYWDSSYNRGCYCSSNDPTSKELRKYIDKMFEIFNWHEIFEGIYYFKKKISKTIKKINRKSGTPFSNMIYLDKNKKYDRKVVRRFHIFRWIVRKGITYNKMKDAFANYSKTLKDDNIYF